MPETREWWLDEPLEGRLWLVRPPWPSWTLDDVFTFLWSVIDWSGSDDQRDDRARLDLALDALCWPEERARAQLVRARAEP